MVYTAADGSGTVTAQIFYDNSQVALSPPTNQPLIEKGSPPAACLVVNTTGGTAQVLITGPNDSQTVSVPPGTTRLRLSQLTSRGIVTRADLAGFGLSSP